MKMRLLEKRMKRKGKSDEFIAIKKQTRERRLNRTGSVFKSITAGAARAVVSGMIGGQALGAGVSMIPGLKKLPVVKDMAAEAADVAIENGMARLSPVRAMVRDLIPLRRELEEGDYLGALWAGLAFLIQAGFAAWLLNRFGVTLPPGIMELLFELLGTATAPPAG